MHTRSDSQKLIYQFDIWIIGFLLDFYSYFGISSHVLSKGIVVPVLFVNTMTVKIRAINSSLIKFSWDTELWGMEHWKFFENGGTSIISNENYSLFYFAGQRWPSWSILNPVDSERLEGDKWSSASMFSQKSPNKEHLSLPGHDVRRPSMILFGIVNDSWIIPR